MSTSIPIAYSVVSFESQVQIFNTYESRQSFIQKMVAESIEHLKKGDIHLLQNTIRHKISAKDAALILIIDEKKVRPFKEYRGLSFHAISRALVHHGGLSAWAERYTRKLKKKVSVKNVQKKKCPTCRVLTKVLVKAYQLPACPICLEETGISNMVLGCGHNCCSTCWEKISK